MLCGSCDSVAHPRCKQVQAILSTYTYTGLHIAIYLSTCSCKTQKAKVIIIRKVQNSVRINQALHTAPELTRNVYSTATSLASKVLAGATRPGHPFQGFGLMNGDRIRQSPSEAVSNTRYSTWYRVPGRMWTSKRYKSGMCAKYVTPTAHHPLISSNGTSYLGHGRPVIPALL